MSNMVVEGVYAPHFVLFQKLYKTMRESNKSSTIKGNSMEIPHDDRDKTNISRENKRDCRNAE